MGSNSSLSNISIFWLNFYWNSCPHNTYVLFDRTQWKYGSLSDGRKLLSLNPAPLLPEITRPSGRKSDFHGFWMIGRLFWLNTALLDRVTVYIKLSPLRQLHCYFVRSYCVVLLEVSSVVILFLLYCKLV